MLVPGRENVVFVYLFVSRQFPGSPHFFVSQMFEAGDVDGIRVQGKEFIPIGKTSYVLSFKIPESLAILLLFLVFFFFF